MIRAGSDTGWYFDGTQDRYRWPGNKPEMRSAAQGLPEILSSRDRMIEHMHRYFGALGDGSPRYAGSLFETFASRSRTSSGFSFAYPRFNECHILAAESLSIKIPSRAAIWLLEPDAVRDSALDECGQLLRRHTEFTGQGVAPESWTDDTSPFSKVHERLRDVQISDFGRVTRSKILAALFPGVVPIRDSHVEQMLGLEKSNIWWKEILKVLQDDGGRVARDLASLNLSPDASRASLLRRLDVVLWMEYRAIHSTYSD